MNNILIRNKDLYISTSIISKECNVEHRAVLQLIKTHRSDIEDFGVLLEEKEKIPKGRPLSVFLLNEEQFIFLVTLMQNSKVTVQAKKIITKEFFRMRQQLLEVRINQQNQEWLEARQEGKKVRKDTTNIYKSYLEYAIEQGSKNYAKSPNRVYTNFTKMINKALFDFEFKVPKNKSSREYMSKMQLNTIQSAELMTQKIIHDEIDKGTEYHEIYQIVKSKMNNYAELVGKSTIIELLINGDEQKQIGGK